MPAGDMRVDREPDVGREMRDGDVADRAIEHELAGAWAVPNLTAHDERLDVRGWEEAGGHGRDL